MKSIKNVYKEIHDFDKRVSQSTSITSKHQGKIPIILMIDPTIKCTTDRYYKYLVSGDLDGSYLMSIVRKKLVIDSRKALFCLTEKNGIFICSSINFVDLYSRCKDEDGFLYINVLMENTFGN
jgi:GABA(A) receptor-associated protein